MKHYPDLSGEIRPLDPENPEPGVYIGVDFWTYLKINAISRTDLSDFRKAPERFRAPREEPGPALIFGTQYHSYVLEPALFSEQFHMYDGKRDKRVKEYQALLEKAGGPEYIYKPKDLETLKAMRDSLMKYEKAAKILTNKNPKEVTVVAKHPDTGFMLKIRIDVILINDVWIADLKTTRDASWDKFRWAIRDYWYDGQAAFYLMVCSLTPGLDHLRRFVICAQEKTEESRYMVRTYAVHQNDVSRAFIEVQRLLPELKTWIDSGNEVIDEIADIDTYSTD